MVRIVYPKHMPNSLVKRRSFPLVFWSLLVAAFLALCAVAFFYLSMNKGISSDVKMRSMKSVEEYLHKNKSEQKENTLSDNHEHADNVDFNPFKEGTEVNAVSENHEVVNEKVLKNDFFSLGGDQKPVVVDVKENILLQRQKKEADGLIPVKSRKKSEFKPAVEKKKVGVNSKYKKEERKAAPARTRYKKLCNALHLKESLGIEELTNDEIKTLKNRCD